MSKVLQYLVAEFVIICLTVFGAFTSQGEVVGTDKKDDGPVNKERAEKTRISGILLHQAENRYRWENIVDESNPNDMKIIPGSGFYRVFLSGESVGGAGNPAHYFITKDKRGIAKLICIAHPGKRIAYHAGSGLFFGTTKGNEATIGIEFMGYTAKGPPSDAQLEKGKELLRWLRRGRVPDETICDFMRDSYAEDLKGQSSFPFVATGGTETDQMSSDRVVAHCDGAANIYRSKEGAIRSELQSYKKSPCYEACADDVAGVIELGRKPCGKCFLTDGTRGKLDLNPVGSEQCEIGTTVEGCLVVAHEDYKKILEECDAYPETCRKLKKEESVVKIDKFSRPPLEASVRMPIKDSSRRDGSVPNYTKVQVRLKPGETVYRYLLKNFGSDSVKRLDEIKIGYDKVGPFPAQELNGCKRVIPPGKDIWLYLPPGIGPIEDENPDESWKGVS